MIRFFYLDVLMASSFFVGAAAYVQTDLVMKLLGIIISVLAIVGAYKGIQERNLRIKILKKRLYGGSKL